MKAKTHVCIGTATTATLFCLAENNVFDVPFITHPITFGLSIIGAIIGSVLMDNDTEGTTIAGFLPISNKIITSLAKRGVKACYHRHLFHSLLCLPLIVLCLLFLFRGDNIYCSFLSGLFVGLVSHTLADALLSNTWILYPICKKPFSILGLTHGDNPRLYNKIEKFCNKLAGLVAIITIGGYIYTNINLHL